MRFEVGCVIRFKASLAIALPDQSSLSVLAWSGDGLGSPVLIDCRCANDRSDGISISESVIKTFDDDGRRTFATTISTGSLIKSVRLTSFGQKSVGHDHEIVGIENDIGSGYDGHVGISRMNALTSLVKCSQGCGATGIYGLARTVQIVEV